MLLFHSEKVEPSFEREKQKELNAENESDKFLAFISDVYRPID